MVWWRTSITTPSNEACGISKVYRIIVCISVVMQALWDAHITCKRIPTPKAPAPCAIPPGPQPHITALLQLARKAEAGNRRRLGDTPGVVAGCGLRDSGVAQRGTDTPQSIDTIPRPGTAALLGEEPLDGCAIDVALAAVGEEVA